MRRRDALASVAALAVAPALRAQSPSRPPRIGMLFFGERPAEGIAAEPIVRALAALGWVDGRNVALDVRYARGDRERYPALAAELGAAAPTVLFCIGSDILKAFARETSNVPVVFAVSDDPVANGLVATLARPGGRYTGVSFMSPQLAAKRLELLREFLPSMRRLAVMSDVGHHAIYMPELARAADAARIELSTFVYESPGDFAGVYTKAKAAGAEALFVMPSRYTLAYARQLADLSIEHRLPSISAYDAFARGGGLVAYGPTTADVLASAATFIDRILRGAKPADLPVELAPRIALIVNARTASALGLAIPPAVLARADEVVR